VSPTSSAGAPTPGSRSHAVVRIAWIAAAAYAALFVLGMGVTYLAATPSVCGACHEMTPAVTTWQQSPHARVGCPDCHETRRPWYLFPETLVARGAMLKRDLQAHWALGSAPASGSQGIHALPIADSTCEHCHDPSRTVTMRNGMLIDHAKHAKRNKSCLGCHIWTAHPDPKAERPLLLMERCFTCHGLTRAAKAPGTCDVCHQASFSKRPASHGPAAWQTAHGKVALAGGQNCSMCHKPSFCRDCHGLEIPHPAGWEKGRTGHGVVASKSVKVCAKCHRQGADLCSMCHHTGFEPAKGPWITQHPSTVDQRGVSFCLTCHEPTYCTACHSRLARITAGSGGK
jgi:hypothetical protein